MMRNAMLVVVVVMVGGLGCASTLARQPEGRARVTAVSYACARPVELVEIDGRREIVVGELESDNHWQAADGDHFAVWLREAGRPVAMEYVIGDGPGAPATLNVYDRADGARWSIDAGPDHVWRLSGTPSRSESCLTIARQTHASPPANAVATSR